MYSGARAAGSKRLQNSLKNEYFKQEVSVLRSKNFKLWSEIKENSVNYCDSFSSQLLLDRGKCNCSRQPLKTWPCHYMYNVILGETHTTNKRGKESIYLAFIRFSRGLIPRKLFSGSFGRASSGSDKPSSRNAFHFQAYSQICEKRLLASLCPSVRMEQLGSYMTDFYEIWYLGTVLKIYHENSSVIKMWQE